MKVLMRLKNKTFKTFIVRILCNIHNDFSKVLISVIAPKATLPSIIFFIAGYIRNKQKVINYDNEDKFMLFYISPLYDHFSSLYD